MNDARKDTTEAQDPAQPRTVSQRFDRELFTLKQSEVSNRMRAKRDAAIPPAPADALDIINPQIEILSEGLAETDRNARDVWKIQGQAVTAEFVRDVLKPEAEALIKTQARVIRSILEGRLGLDYEHDVLKAAWPLAEEVNRLKTEVNNRYEIEVRTLEYQTESAGAQNSDKKEEPVDSKSSNPERLVERGKFCSQVIDEMRRIKNLVVGTGRSIGEVQQDHPEMAVWKVRMELGPEDQEAFNHPRQWGPIVGYAQNVLSRVHDVSPHTINSWVKAYRKDVRTKKV